MVIGRQNQQICGFNFWFVGTKKKIFSNLVTVVLFSDRKPSLNLNPSKLLYNSKTEVNLFLYILLLMFLFLLKSPQPAHAVKQSCSQFVCCEYVLFL